MDIKYNVSKYKDSKIQEVKDSVSIEEPLEMRLKFKKNGKIPFFYDMNSRFERLHYFVER